jgi:hypothetical protein
MVPEGVASTSGDSTSILIRQDIDMVARGEKISAEQRQKMTDGLLAAKERKRIIGFPLGCRVRVNTPNEPHYHGKVGEVSSHNMGEAGVSFGGGTAVWFMPDTLIRVPNEKRNQNGGSS